MKYKLESDKNELMPFDAYIGMNAEQLSTHLVNRGQTKEPEDPHSWALAVWLDDNKLGYLPRNKTLTVLGETQHRALLSFEARIPVWSCAGA